MAFKIAGVDIAKTVAKAVAPLLQGTEFAMTLTRVTPGVRGPDVTAGTNPTETAHTCKGVVSDYAVGQIDGTIIKQGDRRIVILAGTIAPAAVPVPNDKLTVEGRTYRIVDVRRDPVAATYECQARGAA